MDRHTIETLEFPKVLSLIEGKCLTPFGREVVRDIQPLQRRDLIERRQREISEMKDIINFGEAFPLYNVPDSRELLKRSRLEGMFLEPKEMLVILELVEVSMGIHDYNTEGRENFPLITEYIREVRAFPELKREIRKAVDENGDVKDSASSELKRLRRELADTRRTIVNRLQRILGSHRKQAGWQDDVVTQRSGRYVIPIPSNLYRSDDGILHDRSQSGATLYVEPTQTVELNNRVHMLAQEERSEIDRILRAITAEIALRSEPLLENTRLMGRLDAIHACAAFSNQIKGERPQVGTEASLDIVDARHPLLTIQFGGVDKVVPTSLGLTDARQGLLITGPNTGGKTIALKTVGLAVLMSQSGLHVAADGKSSVGIFDEVYADIGDEQSIELSLSTFSSHMRNVVAGLRGASPRTLLLFDEIGAGTDPKEGAALAEAIILHALGTGTRLIATTHYSQLKTLALDHPEIENASLQFDRDTLAPTYELLVGIPGSSYAVEIAGRLGLPAPVCEDASRRVGQGERSLAELIASLEAELSKLREDRNELADRLARAKELEDYYVTHSQRLKNEIEQIKKQALDETEGFIDKTRREVEQLVAEIRKSQASRKTVKKFHSTVRKGQQRISQGRTGLDERPAGPDSFNKGDAVEILSLGKQGEISDILGRDRARVRVGNVVTTVQLRNLRKVDHRTSPTRPAPNSEQSLDTAMSPEINLLGMTVEEGMQAVDKFIDRAVVAGMQQIYVIHGKGTGALRRGLTDYLRSHRQVDSIRLGNWNEGGSGVTVVKLKQ